MPCDVCEDYQDVLDERSIACSMSRRGNCLDSAANGELEQHAEDGAGRGLRELRCSTATSAETRPLAGLRNDERDDPGLGYSHLERQREPDLQCAFARFGGVAIDHTVPLLLEGCLFATRSLRSFVKSTHMGD